MRCFAKMQLTLGLQFVLGFFFKFYCVVTAFSNRRRRNKLVSYYIILFVTAPFISSASDQVFKLY